MKYFIVISLLVSAVCAETPSVSSILDQLDEMLATAYAKGNTNGVQAVQSAKYVLTTAAGAIESTKVQHKIAKYQGYIDEIAKSLPDLQKLVQQEGNLKSRSFLGDSTNFISSKVSLLSDGISDSLNKLNSIGMGGLAALVESIYEKIVSNPRSLEVVQGLETIQGGIEQLNKMTSGAIEPLNTLSDVLSNLNSVGNMFNTLTKVNSTDGLIDTLIKTLATAESSNAKKVQTALAYVCNGINDIEQ